MIFRNAPAEDAGSHGDHIGFYRWQIKELFAFAEVAGWFLGLQTIGGIDTVETNKKSREGLK